ncbi:thioesterase-like superfamily-domain-containing protein [Xylariaceae sp. FL0662B]|nr:thioesterase-like superfamily-domain-containing protein [Xylariaceae sp. FL0662B]
MATTFAEATAIEAIDTHTYSANFKSEWCVGSVPHGGCVTSIFLRVAATHFRTTLAAQNQPHTITLHLEFLRRTQEGPATLKVRDVKLGRLTSTVHITLFQDGREEVVGYLTNTNLDAENGPTFNTGWSLQPSPPPADLPRLAAEGDDTNWMLQKHRSFQTFRKVYNNFHVYLPRNGQVMASMADEWLRLASGERFTTESLGVVSDLFPLINLAMMREQNKGEKDIPMPAMWYPTLVLNLDIKKALPPGGVEWLFVRVQAKSARNGRDDFEVVILDEAGEIVALSHHVAFAVSAERNMAERRKDPSKI